MNLNGRVFKASENSESGEVTGLTTFRYYEEDGIVWADYSGGSILKGNMIGKRVGDAFLDMRYQHVNKNGEIKTGICHSRIKMRDDGKFVLKENWKWTCDDFSEGESVVEEV